MNTSWTMAQAKRDFELGYLDSFAIERSPFPELGNWYVLLRSGSRSGFLVDAKAKTTRYFRTADAAVSALEGIGFKVVSMVKA